MTEIVQLTCDGIFTNGKCWTNLRFTDVFEFVVLSIQGWFIF